MDFGHFYIPKSLDISYVWFGGKNQSPYYSCVDPTNQDSVGCSSLKEGQYTFRGS